MIELRELAVDDWPTWRELRLAALAEAPHAFSTALAEWQGPGDREDRWRARLALAGSINFVALLDGRPAGMASGIPGDQPSVAEIISVWVSPEARGRGVADRLIGAVTQWARERRFEVLTLSVAEGNDAAVRCYTRSGFGYTGEVAGTMPDGVRREYVMAKKLT